MTEQEKREMDEYIATEIIGWMKQIEPNGNIVDNNGFIQFPFTRSLDSVALMEQKIEEMGLEAEYITELYRLVFTANELLQSSIIRNEFFRVKTADPLLCCIAAKRAWETLKSKGE